MELRETQSFEFLKDPFEILVDGDHCDTITIAELNRNIFLKPQLTIFFFFEEVVLFLQDSIALWTYISGFRLLIFEDHGFSTV